MRQLGLTLKECGEKNIYMMLTCPALPFQIFTVQLTLGEQVWEAEGTSIKKAQHSTAAKALEESVLPRPAPRSPKVDINSNPGILSPTKKNMLCELKKHFKAFSPLLYHRNKAFMCVFH